MRRALALTLSAVMALFLLCACSGTSSNETVIPSDPADVTESVRPAPAPSPEPAQEPSAEPSSEPDLLALDDGDELIFYHPEQDYSSGISIPYGLRLAENWVKMTQAEEEEYFGISFDLTDAVSDLAITRTDFGRYEDEHGVRYDVIGVRYQGEDRHRTFNLSVGRAWLSIKFSDYHAANKIPSSRVNGVEIKILSSTLEYWEVETEEGWEWYAEGEPDRPEEAVYYSGPYYQAEFDCHENHFSLQASGLTQEEFGRVLKHFTM